MSVPHVVYGPAHDTELLLVGVTEKHDLLVVSLTHFLLLQRFQHVFEAVNRGHILGSQLESQHKPLTWARTVTRQNHPRQTHPRQTHPRQTHPRQTHPRQMRIRQKHPPTHLKEHLLQSQKRPNHRRLAVSLFLKNAPNSSSSLHSKSFHFFS